MAFAVLSAAKPVYAGSSRVEEKCPAAIHEGCSHSGAQYHFYSTGYTYVLDGWSPIEEPEYKVEGREYRSNGEKSNCAVDTSNHYSTDFFKNGFVEGWYYSAIIGGDNCFYPCEEPATHYYTLTIVNGSVASGESISCCCSIMQGDTASITADDAPSGKVFDKWEITAHRHKHR